MTDPCAERELVEPSAIEHLVLAETLLLERYGNDAGR
jgi:hypothetical protein